MACRLDVSLYCYGSPALLKGNWQENIEMLYLGDSSSDDFVPSTEHIFAIRLGSVIVAYAYNVPQLNVDDHWFHAVGVWTHANYRNQGLGKAVTSALVEHIASENGVALWNSDVRNIASIKLSRSVGFTEYLRILSWK